MSQLKHTPTDEQQAVIDAVAMPDASVMVDAGAGCTKSSTLEMAAPKVKLPAMAVAFNKKIAMELKPRMPSNFDCKTFNGLGHQAVMRVVQPSLKLEEKKVGKLITQVAKDRDIDLSSEQWDDVRKLVTGVMQVGITPQDRGTPLTGDTKEAWAEVAFDRWISPESFEFLYDIARDVLEQDIRQLEENGVISFDDQVYYSACIKGQFPQFPVVFVDESQDLSPLNHAMLAKSIRPDGRLVVVGDPKQAIYGFRGADTRSMKNLRKLRPEGAWQDRDLLITFRCPKLIVERQQRHYPGYRAWHTNPEGRIERIKPGENGITLDEGWSWRHVQAMLPHPQASIMVICRNNGPLLALAFGLIRSGVGCYMLGREMGKGLIALSRKLCPEDGATRDVCAGKIGEWMESECSLARANKQEEKVAGITDRGECLLAVIDSGCRDAGELRMMLSKLFSREAGQVMLSSGHKAKGLESDVVLHLDPWRIPSKYAREATKEGDDRQLVQEWNLKYVIETRTKHTYIEANLEDFSNG